jgi:hypothetical protein
MAQRASETREFTASQWTFRHKLSLRINAEPAGRDVDGWEGKTVKSFSTVAYRSRGFICQMRSAISCLFLIAYGGDDGARTRDLCRDRAAL